MQKYFDDIHNDGGDDDDDDNNNNNNNNNNTEDIKRKEWKDDLKLRERK